MARAGLLPGRAARSAARWAALLSAAGGRGARCSCSASRPGARHPPLRRAARVPARALPRLREPVPLRHAGAVAAAGHGASRSPWPRPMRKARVTAAGAGPRPRPHRVHEVHRGRARGPGLAAVWLPRRTTSATRWRLRAGRAGAGARCRGPAPRRGGDVALAARLRLDDARLLHPESALGFVAAAGARRAGRGHGWRSASRSGRAAGRPVGRAARAARGGRRSAAAAAAGFLPGPPYAALDPPASSAPWPSTTRPASSTRA